jgi:folate-dependent phosphoribosylglycinamide formyltransferase PurN
MTAATQFDRASPPSTAAPVNRAKILFLGNAYNSLSVACLEALLASGQIVIVGIHDPAGQNIWRTLRRSAERDGWGFIFRKAATLARVKARIILRGAGLSFHGHASLPELCRARKVEMISCPDPNSAEFIAEVRRLGVDLIVVAAFSRILKAPLLEAARLGVVNVHPSMLPKFRGPNPIYWALAQGATRTGVTLHFIDEGIDSGDVIARREVGIERGETERSLFQKCCGVAAQMLRESLPLIVAGTAARNRQDESAASYQSHPPKGASRL